MEKMQKSRRPKNIAEGKFYDQAVADNKSVTKRGWPDFIELDEKTNEIRLVEIKPHKNRKLKNNQSFILKRLSEYGVPCYRWSPDSGYERIKNEY